VLKAGGGKSARGTDPIVPLARLEAEAATGQTTLLAALKTATGRSEGALKRDLTVEPDMFQAGRLLQAADNDSTLRDRLVPFFGLLDRTETGEPAIVTAGSLYVGAGADRRSSGTHYTPRSLTEPIVRYTLEPLVYHGPAEGLPAEQWTLHPPRKLLELKVCDIAMGSGAFLVQACRYLSERLVEAWEESEDRVRRQARPEDGIVPGITPYGEPSEGSPAEALIPREPAERLALARRLVADRCLYGVDKNPMAVEMAKLSLWLTTLDKGRPFTFLDHALKAGDSLVGVSDLEQVRRLHPKPTSTTYNYSLTADLTDQAVREAVALREHLERMPTRDISDVRAKYALLAQARAKMATVMLLGDLVAGAAVATAGKSERVRNEQLGLLTPVVLDALDNPDLCGPLLTPSPDTDSVDDPLAGLKQRATDLLLPAFGRGDDEDGPAPVPLHWPLEYPEVFAVEDSARRGFDAIVGNPPFMGGLRLDTAFGERWREYIVESLAGNVRGVRGTADLCAYFFLQGAQLLNKSGVCAFLATNTIAQGDTRTVGLDQICSLGMKIIRANASQKWPGAASIEVSVIWIGSQRWQSKAVLDDRAVEFISSSLTASSEISLDPFRLLANEKRGIVGSFVHGEGFLITPEEAAGLIGKNTKNSDVLFRYMTGQDLNSTPDQVPSRFVINFRQWPIDRDSSPPGYSGPVASDYPECLAIIQDRVRPERLAKVPKNAWDRGIRERWWQFAAYRPTLIEATSHMAHVIVKAEVSNIVSFAMVANNSVFSHMTIVFAFDTYGALSLLQSSIHETWARRYGSSMRNDLRYTPVSCFSTFAFPESLDSLEDIGARYHTHRQGIMVARREGLTKTYNRVHDPNENADDIQRLRDLRVEMDNAVAAAYGWSDLDLGHGFHQTAQGLRFTISEEARREVLGRLLALNHERYAEEVAAGLHDGPKGKGKSKAAARKEGAESSKPARRGRPPTSQAALL